MILTAAHVVSSGGLAIGVRCVGVSRRARFDRKTPPRESMFLPIQHFCISIPSLFLQSLACCARSFPASRPDPREAGGMLRGCATLVLIFFGVLFFGRRQAPSFRSDRNLAVAAAVCSYLARQHKCSTPWACLSRTPGTRFISSLLSPVLLSHSLAQVPLNALVHDHRLDPAHGTRTCRPASPYSSGPSTFTPMQTYPLCIRAGSNCHGFRFQRGTWRSSLSRKQRFLPPAYRPARRRTYRHLTVLFLTLPLLQTGMIHTPC